MSHPLSLTENQNYGTLFPPLLQIYMAKLKTVKSIKKRFTIKRKSHALAGVAAITIIKRTNGQDHFNARESGKVKRNKRSDRPMSHTVKQTLLRGMPHG